MTQAPEELLRCLPGGESERFDWQALRRLSQLAGLLQRMEETPQDPVWHGEGNVWLHTQRVCEALCDSPRFRALDAPQRQALALAALLHDAGKTQTTRLEEGRWVSPHHAQAGSRLVRTLLWQQLGCAGTPALQQLREAVCLLIRWHSLPVRWFSDPQPERLAARLAANGVLTPLFTLESLFILSEADENGREAPDRASRLEAIGDARAQAESEECLRGPYPFSSLRTRYAYLNGRPVWKDQDLFDGSWGEVLLLSGLPASGKDTWLKKNAPELPVVSLDAIRKNLKIKPEDPQGAAVQAARELARSYLRRHQPFAWNATSLTPLRTQQAALFERYHASVRIVWLETDWQTLLKRNAGRASRVPENTLQDMLARAEPPLVWEAQRVEWLCT